MKLEPIKNPHAKVGSGIQKKTKQEEKDDLIDKTKKTTLDKYGVSYIISHFVAIYMLLNICNNCHFRRKCWARNTCRIRQL